MNEHGILVLIRARAYTPSPPSGWLITRSGAREFPWQEAPAGPVRESRPARATTLVRGTRLKARFRCRRAGKPGIAHPALPTCAGHTRVVRGGM